MLFNKLLPAAVLLFAAFGCRAADDDQKAMRLDPTLEVSEAAAIDYSVYPFLNLNANEVRMNGADWTELAEKLRAAKEGRGTFSIVYLGDSHIQADFGGAVLRERMARVGGSAGRGLIIPFKLAGTNEPLDYKMTLDGQYASSRLLKTPWATDMPFTGIAISPAKGEHALELSCNEPFSKLKVLYRGDEPVVKGLESDSGAVVSTDIRRIGNGIEVSTDTLLTGARLRFEGEGRHTMAGVVLTADSVGTHVHSIGNNGATYGTYNGIDGFAGELACLSPDLVIVALGTNEAFGKTDMETFADDMRTLLGSISAEMPQAKLLLVSPTECFRRVYRKRKGRRRRVSSLVVNDKTHTISGAVAAEAERAGIPYYDHFALAGGVGSAAKMQKCGVLGKDGVHFTAEGYRLWGNLLADAILNALETENSLDKKNDTEAKNF